MSLFLRDSRGRLADRTALAALLALLPLASQAQFSAATNSSTRTDSSSRGITYGDGKLHFVTVSNSNNTFGVVLSPTAPGAPTSAHRETSTGLNPSRYRQVKADLPTLSLVLRDVTATAPLAHD